MMELKIFSILSLGLVIGQHCMADGLPNTFSVANAKCLESVAPGQEDQVLPPVKAIQLESEQKNLVARVTATFKKSWKQTSSIFSGGERILVDTSRSINQQTSKGIIMKSLRPPEKSTDFAHLTHEMCHSLGNKSSGYSKYGEQLGKDCQIGRYGSMTAGEFKSTWPDSSRDPHTGAHHEHFAEACTLFLLNPSRLKRVCPQGYDKMTKVFGGPSESRCDDDKPLYLAGSTAGASSGMPLLAAGLLPLVLAMNNGGGVDTQPAPTLKSAEAMPVGTAPAPVAVSSPGPVRAPMFGVVGEK